MMPTFPSVLKIGNREVPVLFQPNLTDEAGNQLMGFYDMGNPRIVISSGMSSLATVETFWHELMHAIFDYTRFGVDMAMEMRDEDSPEMDAFKVEERAAENLAKTFLQVIQDNNIGNIKT